MLGLTWVEVPTEPNFRGCGLDAAGLDAAGLGAGLGLGCIGVPGQKQSLSSR